MKESLSICNIQALFILIFLYSQEEISYIVALSYSHQSRDRLATLVAEHLDHLHYVNDILLINIDTLNDVLSDQLLNRLLIPLYVYSLTKRKRYDARMVRNVYNCAEYVVHKNCRQCHPSKAIIIKYIRP